MYGTAAAARKAEALLSPTFVLVRVNWKNRGKGTTAVDVNFVRVVSEGL